MRAVVVSLVLTCAVVARGQQSDAQLAALIDEAIAARPELAQAQAELRAARERVPQASAWPDPMLQVGVQNDSFNKWQVGKMETSWVLFMASQTIPFPGKQALRGDVASLEVTRRKLAVERVRLGTIADVRRAYLSMQLSRARVALLDERIALLRQAADAAQNRYESGSGAQADILRARLEVSRVQQQRVARVAEAAVQQQALNRLRGKSLGSEIDGAAFAGLVFPPVPDETAVIERFENGSPELLASRASIQGAQRSRELSQRQYFPDFSVGAGVMVRGSLDPMWTVTLGVPLPVFAAVKQSREVAEANANLSAAGSNAVTVQQLVVLRVAQQLASWRALEQVWNAYQQQLFGEADAATESTLMQYRTGLVPFSSVLEATNTSIELKDEAFGVLTEAWRLAIAQDELSLNDAGQTAPAGM